MAASDYPVKDGNGNTINLSPPYSSSVGCSSGGGGVPYLSPCSEVLLPSTVGSFLQGHSRIPFLNISGRPITNMSVFYGHFSFNASLEWVPTSTISVRAAVEYPVGFITPLLNAAGGRDISVAGGGVGEALKASGLKIPCGAIYYIRTRCLVSGGDTSIARAYSNGATFGGGTIQSHLNATIDGTDYTTSGTQPTNSGAGYGPFGICSYEEGNSGDNIALFGDSIMRGNVSGISFAEEAVKMRGLGFINLSFSGAAISSGGNNNPVRRMALARAMGCKHVVCNFPINDLIAGRTNAQIQTDMITFWTALKGAGFEKIIQATCTPKTTDTSDPGTAISTPTGAFTGGASSFRSVFNAYVRSQVGLPNRPTAVFEFADVLESGRDTGLWRSPPANYTPDALHLTTLAGVMSNAELGTVLAAQGL